MNQAPGNAARARELELARLDRERRISLYFAMGLGAFGIIIVLIFYVIAFYLPVPQNPKILFDFLLALQAILAIVIAAVAAVLPGLFTANIKMKAGNWLLGVRATGALGVFALVFLVDPRALTRNEIEGRLRRLGLDVEYNRVLDRCRQETRWEGVRGNVKVGALTTCQHLVRIDPERWEGHVAVANVFFNDRKFKQYKENIEIAFTKFMEAKDFRFALLSDYSGNDASGYLNLLSGVALAHAALLQRKEGEKESVGVISACLSAIQGFVERIEKSYQFQDHQFRFELLYRRAWHLQNIWLSISTVGDNNEYQNVVLAWKNALAKAEHGYATWIHYHLACARMYGDKPGERNRNALMHLKEMKKAFVKETKIREKSVENVKWLLLEPETSLLYPGDPVPCPALVTILIADSEIAAVVKSMQ